MGRLLILPFVQHPQVPDIPNAMLPLGPITAPSYATPATREDVVRLYVQYLHRAPEDDGAIAGRVGRPLVDVELEIASSDEAIAILAGTNPVPQPPGTTIDESQVSQWAKRVGLLLAADIATELHMPTPPIATWVPLAVQADIEDAGGTSYGARTNNPLNLRALLSATYPGQTGISPNGFAEFSTLEAGALACARNYTTNDSAGYYRAVVDAFRRGDVLALAQAIDESKWNAGGYGGRIIAKTRAALRL